MLVVNCKRKTFTLAGFLIKIYENTSYHHSAIIYNDHVYETVANGYQKISIEAWVKKNDILFYQNAVEYLNLSEFQIEEIINDAETLLNGNVPYGTLTLIGIILKDLFSLKWFRDGRKSLICSELIYRLFRNYLPPADNPDYVTPKDVFNMFQMKKNNLY